MAYYGKASICKAGEFSGLPVDIEWRAVYPLLFIDLIKTIQIGKDFFVYWVRKANFVPGAYLEVREERSFGFRFWDAEKDRLAE